jgi:hypothetical protein
MKASAICSSVVAFLACASSVHAADVPVGIHYCGGDRIKREISFAILPNPADQWDARVTINGKVYRAMTAFSFFGKAAPPKGFIVALLGEDRSEILVFREADKDWLEFGDYTYRKCD